MAHSDYINSTDDGLAKQMVTFRDNIARELAALGLLATDPDIVQQALDATRFRAVVDFNETMQSAAMSWTAEKNFERVKGSVPIVDTILCHAPSVRRKAGSIKINLGDWRWQLAVGRGGYPWLKNVWFAWFVVHASIGARVS